MKRDKTRSSSKGPFDKYVKKSPAGNYELFEKAYNLLERIEAQENAKKSHPKVKLDSKVNINNYMNAVLHGPLVMGSNLQQIDVIYDTASSGLAVESDLCTSALCAVDGRFNTTASSTYVKLSNAEVEIDEYFNVYYPEGN
jgi:hypothetical protein